MNKNNLAFSIHAALHGGLLGKLGVAGFFAVRQWSTDGTV